MIMEIDVTYSSDYCASGVWTKTTELRWKKAELIDDFIGTVTEANSHELQQLWRSDKGEEKWEPIEVVK